MNELFPFYVCSPLCHDGEKYSEGDTVELTKKQADRLLALPHPPIDLEKSAEAAAESGSTPTLLERLVAAIADLNPDNADHFTNAGKPEIKALNAIVSEKVSGADRDTAWELYQKENPTKPEASGEQGDNTDNQDSKTPGAGSDESGS